MHSKLTACREKSYNFKAQSHGISAEKRVLVEKSWKRVCSIFLSTTSFSFALGQAQTPSLSPLRKDREERKEVSLCNVTPGKLFLSNLSRHKKKKYRLAPDKYSRHANYYKMLVLLRSLSERALGKGSRRANCLIGKAAQKSSRRAELFYRSV